MKKKIKKIITDLDWFKIITYSIIIIIIITILYILLIKPTLIGYDTYKKIKYTNNSIEEYQKGLNQYKNNYYICQKYLQKCENNENITNSKLDKLKEQIYDLKLNNQILKIKLNNTKNNYNLKIEYLLKDHKNELKTIQENKEKENNNFNEKYNKLNKEKEQIEKNYYNLAKNIAKIICCKEKIENTDIDSYDIINNQIICKTEGEYKISCSFE